MKMFFGLPRPDRPPALRIKSVEELARGFRPRWVKLRRGMFGAFGLCFVFLMFLVSPTWPHQGMFWLTVALSLVMQMVGIFAMFPKESSAFIGLLLRPFPKLAVQHGRFENWLEFDLDWDETRR